MVEMHLLSVNADFSYNAIYGLGVVTAFDRFMQGYRPEADKDSIFNALCQAIEQDPQLYRHDAEQLVQDAQALSLEQVLAQLKAEGYSEDRLLFRTFQQISSQPQLKYSRLLAIGLYTLLETLAPERLKEEESRSALLTEMSEPLGLLADKVKKDLELYRSNLDKMVQAQAVLEDILKADRKKREERQKAKDAIATPPSSSQESP